MKFPEFTDDLSIVSKLGDNPGADNGLTAEGLKAKFDEGPLALQRFMNSVLIAKLNEIFAAGGQLNDGLIMTGPINMNQNMLFGLADPKNDSEAVSFGFAKNNYVPKSRMVNGKSLSANITLSASDVGAAPSGYGLGAAGSWVENLNNAKSNGFYSWTNTALNTPFDYGNLLVLNRGDSRVTQIAVDPIMSHSGQIAVRHCTNVSDDTWTEWEFINPNMALGREYRTIKRHNGKAVYVTRLNLGALQNNGSTTGELPNTPTEIVELTGIIRSDAYTEELAFPVFTLSGAIGARLSKAASKQILVKTFADYSAYTATVTVWYTKN